MNNANEYVLGYVQDDGRFMPVKRSRNLRLLMALKPVRQKDYNKTLTIRRIKQ